MPQDSAATWSALALDPLSKLTDDLFVEILSRVSYKSSCRCKCVSTRWRDLISHPDNRKKMPQTLAGFFFNDTFILDRSPKWARCYTDVSEGVYPCFDRPLSFLMQDCEIIDMYGCCNGLLLLRGFTPRCPKTLDYVVCNPVTEKWITVPASIWSGKVGTAHLGFDPAVSSHFHVFEFVPARVRDAKSGGTKALGIYSSKAGAWTHRYALDCPIKLSGLSRSAFLNGVLYLSSYDECVIAVDVVGNCRAIRIPMPHTSGDDVHNVYLSQGQLHLVYEGDSALSIWVLEDPSCDKWTLKHQYSQLQLFGKKISSFVWRYEVVSIHPEHSVIFIVCRRRNFQLPKTLMSYDMDSGKRRFICHEVCMLATTYFPFVPLFSESLADAH